MTDLHRSSARLRELGSVKPTPAAWEEVRGAMNSKWEGLQSIACRTLAAWGGREAVEELRSFISDAWRREAGWGIRSVAIESLAQCIEACDTDWVLDHYFAISGWLSKHELLPLVCALPISVARSRLLAETHSTDRDNRQAAMKAFANMGYPEEEQRAVLARLSEDPDEEIRRGAEALAIGLTSHGS
jgi:HEAT repeat protein